MAWLLNISYLIVILCSCLSLVTEGCDVKIDDRKSLKFSELFQKKPIEKVSHDGGVIYLAVCKKQDDGNTGGIPAVCGTDASICSIAKNGSTEELSWKVPLNLAPSIQDDGIRIILKYFSTTVCSNGSSNTSFGAEIILTCQEEESVESSPILLSSSTSCISRVLWPTRIACFDDNTSVAKPEVDNFGDIVGSDCTVTNTQLGYTYDLRSLARIVEEQNDRGTYRVSICKKEALACGGDSGGCFEEKNMTRYSYGEYNDKLIYRNGTLLLMYKDGAKCDSDEKTRRSTMVQFICDRQAKTGLQQNVKLTLGEYTDCIAHFHWMTEVACAPWRNVSCTTSDSKGNLYDLSTLTSFTTNHEAGHGDTSFLLNVCHTVIEGYDAECPAYAASCLRKVEKGKTSYLGLGTVQGPPSVESDGVLRLKYVRGEICPEDSKRTLTTIIDFECNKNLRNSHPEFSEYTDCTYHFYWETAAACPTRKEDQGRRNEVICHVETSSGHVDLSSLSRDYVPYSITSSSVPGAKFLLNVCQPAISNKQECEGAAVCLLNGGTKKAVSLGKPFLNPVAGQDTVDLLYTHGSVCEDIPAMNYSSRIRFGCDETAGVGRPVLDEYTHDCQFIFEWKTKLACPHRDRVSAPVRKDCIFDDHLTDRVLDLSALKSLPEFKDTGMCTDDVKNATYVVSPRSLKITYPTNEACNSLEKKSLEFLVSCDRKATTPELHHVKGFSCVRLLEVKTAVICNPDDIAAEEKVQNNAGGGYGTAVSWLAGVLIVGGLLVLTYSKRRVLGRIFGRIREGGFQSLSRGDGVRYSEVPSNEEPAISFGPADPRNLHNDSDDELIVAQELAEETILYRYTLDD